MIDFKVVEEFFFRGMLKGWAKAEVKPIIPGLPGSKIFDYWEGSLHLADFFFTTPFSRKSFGLTLIWYDDNLLWFMFYFGQYEKEVIEFLKQVLSATYQDHVWCGGRGQESCRKGNLIYINKPSSNSFTEFKGREYVLDDDGKERGNHWYVGGSMV